MRVLDGSAKGRSAWLHMHIHNFNREGSIASRETHPHWLVHLRHLQPVAAPAHSPYAVQVRQGLAATWTPGRLPSNGAHIKGKGTYHGGTRGEGGARGMKARVNEFEICEGSMGRRDVMALEKME